MKKVLFAIAVVFTMSLTLTSCKSEKKEDVKKEMATKVYQCPMDCEHGKSYSKAGNCPECGMALKSKKPGEKTTETKAIEKHEHKEGDNHEH